ncbi:hypothetical protein JVU11DRAFT_4787 [Chiua virens]|nr:hypothetical protein JVU11DRAFT_4787 [Chiua virens]
MYPHLHVSGTPSPNYIYSGYEQYYPKDSWVHATPSSWPTSYPFPPRSSLPETTINPKVTILPQQPLLVSDIDTPSSISSHSVLTPSSPFAQHDVGEMEPHAIEFDEFDCDEEEDYLDSDFADEMEGIDDMDQEPSPVYGVSAPHVVKSTSALEGALGDTPSSSYDTDLGGFAPADRRLSASVPGYASAPHRSSAATTHQRSAGSPVTQVPEAASHVYAQRNPASSTSLFAPTSPPLYDHVSSSSLAGVFSSPHHPHPSRPTHHHSHSAPLPILQPQPIRPIPPIPIADLTSSASERSSPEPRPRIRDSQPLRTLSPLPLLCQPVSDAIRYQLKASSANSGGSALADVGYDKENTSESMCEGDLVTASGQDRFAPQGLTFCQEHHPSAGGTSSMEQKMYSCGRIGLSIRWQ